MAKYLKISSKDIVMIVLGNLLLAFSVSYFILPYDILTGGIFGVSIALKPLLPHVETTYIAYGLIVSTFLLGAYYLGRGFIAKTLLSSIIYPLFIEMFKYIPYHIETEPILASLYAGLLTGVGVGIVFRSKGSTGGMDVFPLIFKEKFNLTPSTGIMIIDGITVLLGLTTLGTEHVLIGLISVFASSYTVGKIVMLGSDSAKCVYIISSEIDEINTVIHEKLSRGTTLIKTQGGFSHEERDMLMCVLTVEQYPILKSIVETIDNNAFLIVTDSHEVLGEGFSYGHRV